MAEAGLLDLAGRLPRASRESAQEYCRVAEAAAARVSLILAAREDLERLIGPGNREAMRGNHENHARFVCSLLTAFDPAVLVRTLHWVARAYLSHGFSPDYWPVQLDAWLEALRRELSSEAFKDVEPLYAFMRRAMAEILRSPEARAG